MFRNFRHYYDIFGGSEFKYLPILIFASELLFILLSPCDGVVWLEGDDGCVTNRQPAYELFFVFFFKWKKNFNSDILTHLSQMKSSCNTETAYLVTYPFVTIFGQYY